MLGLNTEAREPGPGEHGLLAAQVAQVPRKVEKESNLQEGGACGGSPSCVCCIAAPGRGAARASLRHLRVCRQQTTPKHRLAVHAWVSGEGAGCLSRWTQTQGRRRNGEGRTPAGPQGSLGEMSLRKCPHKSPSLALRLEALCRHSLRAEVQSTFKRSRRRERSGCPELWRLLS